MTGCRDCKRWKGCPGKDWYHYGEIRWCPQQVIWILQHADIFRAGYWVARGEESGGSRQLKIEAYFVKAGIAISEIEARLESVLNQGELLITQVEDGRTLGDLSPGAYEILMYVKGRNRKIEDFNTWKRKRDYRHKLAVKKRRKRTQNAKLDKKSNMVYP